MIESVVRAVVNIPVSSPLRVRSSGGGAPFTPAQLSHLLMRSLDQTPSYASGLLDGLPYITPEEPGTVAVPQPGACAKGDGGNDYCVTSGNLGISGTGSRTVAFWCKLDAATTQCMLSFGSTGGTSTLFALFCNGGQWWFNGSGDDHLFGTADTNWHHHCVTYDGTTIKWYIDGVEATSVSKALNTTDTPLNVFRRVDNNWYSASSIRSVLVDDEAYSPAEVATLYSTHLPPTGKTPLGYWPLQEEGVLNGGLHYNVISNSNHLTANNITAATYNATDSGVTFSYPNVKGYTLSGSVVIPASLTTPSQDAAGNALQVVGPVAHPVTVEVQAWTGDGTAAYVETGIVAATSGSLSILIRPSSSDLSGLKAILGGFTTSTGAKRFYLCLTGGKVGVGIADADHTTEQGTTTLVADTWYTIGLTWTSSTHVLTLNGAVEKTGTHSNSFPSQGMYVGAFNAESSIGNYSTMQIAGMAYTTGGKTYWPLFDQCGPGTANTNRDFHIMCSDGTSVFVPGGKVNGSVAAMSANRCNLVEDWCVKYGGSYNPNLLSYTEDFWPNVIWAKGPGSVSTNVEGSADKWIPDNSTGYHYIGQDVTTEIGATYTYSIEIKAAGLNYVLINSVNASVGNSGPVINLTNGTKVSDYTAALTTTITALSGGWYRVAITFVQNGTGNCHVDINPFPTSTVAAYAGNGTDGVLLRNAQLERASTATPYQANLAAAGTGAFIPGRIDSNLDAAGNAKTLAAGKHGNVYSRRLPNYWGAPELNNIGLLSSTKLAPSQSLSSVATTDTAWSRVQSDGTDRDIAVGTAVSGATKTNVENYTT